MKQHIAALLAPLVTAIALLGSGGCSSKTACENSQCAAGNACIADGSGVVACRLDCSLKADGTGGQSTCPFNYHCVGGKQAYCAADKVAYAKTGGGVWGASCSPQGSKAGLDQNAACDAAQNFWCYATSPTDGAAFCTQYDCTSDADCRGGWWCAAVNAAPNAIQAGRLVGAVRNVCLPRTYCAPCASDIDCSSAGGARARCVGDSAGSKYCAPECNGDSQCNQEASCAASADAPGVSVCTPNAGVCVGDGTFCAPCRSDSDCVAGGACVSSPYSTEHFCAVPSGAPCTYTDGASGSCKLNAQCPKNAIGGGGTSCSFLGKANTCSAKDASGNAVAGNANTWPNIPGSDFCFGEVKLSKEFVPGCWTKAR